MVKTLRESKAKLSELVERAARGEDTLITVRGSVKARLTAAVSVPSPADTESWMNALRQLDQLGTDAGAAPSTDSILDDLRAERF